MGQALDFLKSHKNVVFATIENDKPKIRVFQIMKQEGAVFFFATSKEKDVFKQLQKNNNIEFLAMSENISVRVIGKANFEISDNMAQEIYNNNPVLHRFHDDYRSVVYFNILVEKIDYYDLGTTPVTFESISLV
ncbi:pyridoxamine 5'-phosphate oxidase family protein [Bacteroides salyersiae]|uniref:pyridoxamine 5'-phosphate oxidase family protein n=1 Tax=Bacteroides salyersiae TaxID=291644 RepID=UPI00221EC0C7|nr:pyridoxamine 5'-phosphate oxidase family protein [Bacteroides salyersiae]UYU41086.1 pyridoxamine 5'-phosphate oxidase family protein [Bacteroides salyersiae]